MNATMATTAATVTVKEAAALDRVLAETTPVPPPATGPAAALQAWVDHMFDSVKVIENVRRIPPVPACDAPMTSPEVAGWLSVALALHERFEDRNAVRAWEQKTTANMEKIVRQLVADVGEAVKELARMADYAIQHGARADQVVISSRVPPGAVTHAAIHSADHKTASIPLMGIRVAVLPANDLLRKQLAHIQPVSLNGYIGPCWWLGEPDMHGRLKAYYPIIEAAAWTAKVRGTV